MSGVDCGAEAESEAVSKGEETAIAAAEAVAEKGKFAQAIAKSIGSGDGGTCPAAICLGKLQHLLTVDRIFCQEH